MSKYFLIILTLVFLHAPVFGVSVDQGKLVDLKETVAGEIMFTLEKNFTVASSEGLCANNDGFAIVPPSNNAVIRMIKLAKELNIQIKVSTNGCVANSNKLKVEKIILF